MMATEKQLMCVDEFKKNLCHYCNTYMSEEPCEPGECWVHDVIAQTDTVDAVEVVRCKDCMHYDNSEGIQWCHLNSKFYRGGMDWHSFPEDGFCSYGERKDNGI